MSQDGPPPDPATRTEGESETLDLPEGMTPFAPGQVLGERYQILEMLGRGGMGEVWHAFDLKLRVEVALKALREDFFKSERRLELLRQEVRAARQVMSPNVCRIFDLIELEGRELVSMEYVDGATLLGVLQERGPLELKEAQDIASQFLAGLEAIHKVGLVHRDMKPENIMLTRAGRVVVMDFGLARQDTEGGGSVSGTPAYMAPEQAAGQTVDARADVYAAGVVLAEMVSPGGIKSYESRQTLWEGVRSEPVKLPDSPWAPVLKRAVAKDREGRFNTARTLTRALEDVTLRVEGAEDLHPYPGLASYTEEDAEYFFGREAEVEQMWRKLDGPPRMLALVGPSGAGKSSFLRAGLVAAKATAWAAVVCTPGSSPMRALANTFVEEFAGDAESIRQMLDFEVADSAVAMVGRWSDRHDHALLIIDQFEELFTQNSPSEQRRVADLLNRFVLEADVHVLLSMRDDFFFHCHQYDAFAPLQDGMTLIGPPVGGALRRALVRPATKCGYRFEDDELVEEMLAEVEGERGALPLLAFAAARLWEKRDRDNGLLTRHAYHDIGGVGGALARHAEATIDRIGTDRIAIVRELFRNLVTAEGTRAIREWDDLLSIFSDSQSESQPEEVLRQLIDARLLTSYEVQAEDEAPTRRVEIIHESLLANWPRLVRWQTQDADAAQLRDQLRQAAKTWDEHGRTDDTLWTGSAYREFAVWRERYPGGLTETEEEFARAMTSLATRRRRRRRIAATIVVVFLATVATVLGALWRRSVLETRRAEASKLVALAQAELETDPTEALAYATASLKLADTLAARSMVMRALWEAPPALVLELEDHLEVRFSPEGGWLAVGGQTTVVEVWSDAGDGPIVLRGLDTPVPRFNRCRWISESLLATGLSVGERVRVWSIPEGQLVHTIEFGALTSWRFAGNRLLSATVPLDPTHGGYSLLHSWALADGKPEDLGRIEKEVLWPGIFDPSGSAFIYPKGRTIFARPLPVGEESRDRVVGTHDAEDVRLVPDASTGDRFVSIDGEGELRVWSLSEPDAGPVRVIPRPEGAPAPYDFFPDPTGRWIYYRDAQAIGKGLLWDLSALPGAQPLKLRRSGSWQFSAFEFHPEGDWLAASTRGGRQVSFWPLRRPYPSVVEGASFRRKGLAFSPDGRWLAVTWPPLPARVKLFPLPHTGRTEAPDLGEHSVFSNLFFDTAGTRLTGGHYGPRLSVVPLDGGEPRRLEGFGRETLIESLAFSPSGRLVAAASGLGFIEHTLRVWNLDTGEVRAFDLPRTDTSTFRGYKGGLDNVQNLWFTDEDTLVTVGATKFLRWNLEDGSSEVIVDLVAVVARFAAASADGHKVLIIEQPEGVEGDLCDTPQLYDLAAGTVDALPKFGDCVRVIALDPEGTVAVSGDEDGIIRVGRVAGGEPHLLVGHEGAIEYVAVSPDLRWVASVGSDSTVRLWPMPDLDKPPLHILPHDELIAKLKTLTNLRVVRDEESSTGWKVEIGPFPGWDEVPEW